MIRCRAVWNSLVGLKTAFALRAAPALWRANRVWSSPDDLLGGGFGDQVTFDFQLEALLEERGSVDPHLQSRDRLRRIHVSFWQKDLTGLMEALRPQSPALLAAGAFGGNFQIGSFSLSDGNSFLGR